jgi:hypothetical protein
MFRSYDRSPLKVFAILIQDPHTNGGLMYHPKVYQPNNSGMGFFIHNGQLTEILV